MMISCPQCQTQYNIDENIIPSEGRKMRCAKCGNVWLVLKEEEKNDTLSTIEKNEPAIEEVVPQETPEEEQHQEVQVTEEPQSATIEEKTEISSEEDVQEWEDESAGEPTPEEIAKEEQETETEKTTVDESIEEAEEDVQQKENEPEVSEASMEYSEGTEIPEQLRKVNTSSLYEPENFEEEQKKSGSTRKALIFLIFSMLVSLYVGRFYVVSKFPPMQNIFEAVGISFDVLGEGLAFKDIYKEKLIVDDLNYLVINGSIINESEQTRKIPNLMLFLYDKDGKLIQKAAQKPPVASLTPGETVDFTMNLEAPSVVAIEAEITFTEPKKGRRR